MQTAKRVLEALGVRVVQMSVSGLGLRPEAFLAQAFLPKTLRPLESVGAKESAEATG